MTKSSAKELTVALLTAMKEQGIPRKMAEGILRRATDLCNKGKKKK